MRIALAFAAGAFALYAYWWTVVRPRTLAGRLDALRDPYHAPFDNYGVHFQRWVN